MPVAGPISWSPHATPSADCFLRGAHRAVGGRRRFRRADSDRYPGHQDLAIAASVGMAVLIVTNLLLLPILLSYVGVSAKAAARSLRAEAFEGQNAQRGNSSLLGPPRPVHRAQVGQHWPRSPRLRWEMAGFVISLTSRSAISTRGRRNFGRLALQPRRRFHGGELCRRAATPTWWMVKTPQYR